MHPLPQPSPTRHPITHIFMFLINNVIISKHSLPPRGVTPYDPRFAQQMTLARRIMKKRRNVLRELAK